MHTFSSLGLFVALLLNFALPYKTYEVSPYPNERGNGFKRMRDILVLMMGTLYIAFLAAPAMMSDIYEIPRYITSIELRQQEGIQVYIKSQALAVMVILMYIAFYDYFIMRKHRQRQNTAIKQSKDKTIIEKNSSNLGFIKKSQLLSLVVFIVVGISEGLFQDLFYGPILKPFLIKVLVFFNK